MLKPLIVGNWKMHGSIALIDQLIAALASQLTTDQAQADVLVCPPNLFLAYVRDLLADTHIGIAAQNVCAEDAQQGAYTGEVSAQMLHQAGCSHVLVGHSERRQYYAESDQQVANKAMQALAQGLTPIVCVGETLAQREAQQTMSVIAAQLHAVLAQTKQHSIVVAYEPVWAIGTGLTATPEQAQQVHSDIRAILAAQDADFAQNTHILYGGSVKATTAPDLLAQQDINGVLVGGASLNGDEFVAIAQSI